MSNRIAKKAPIVRLPPKSNVELLLLRSAQVAVIVMGFIAAIFALAAGEYILAPASLGIVLGLMLGPVATRLERRGLPSVLSASLVVVLFIIAICLFAAVLAAPLNFWLARLPQLWANLQLQLSELKGPLEALKGVRDQIRELTGGEGLTVSVDEGMGVESMASLAPAVVGQILIFFACLYFFVATRHQTRTALLKLCFDRRLRWRVAHIFRDVEQHGVALSPVDHHHQHPGGRRCRRRPLSHRRSVGAAVGRACRADQFRRLHRPDGHGRHPVHGRPRRIRHAGRQPSAVAVYLGINVVEAQFVTPMVIGRTMTLNPFIVMLALIFWIWLWGPLGGFIAIPALLVVYAVIRNIMPGINWGVDDRSTNGPYRLGRAETLLQ